MRSDLIRPTVNNVSCSKCLYCQSVILCLYKLASQLYSGCAMQTDVTTTHQDASLNSSQHCMLLWCVHCLFSVVWSMSFILAVIIIVIVIIIIIINLLSLFFLLCTFFMKVKFSYSLLLLLAQTVTEYELTKIVVLYINCDTVDVI